MPDLVELLDLVDLVDLSDLIDSLDGERPWENIDAGFSVRLGLPNTSSEESCEKNVGRVGLPLSASILT
jgi:hypothetical protein